ncbi:MAG: hypothetical protein WCX32_02130 [Clostridia bacterium]|jgi:hypothetical protein|nr:hypothetical protein [Clostridia bacterium]MDD4276197.1 hypothetical protein [Clostridia bacterium]
MDSVNSGSDYGKLAYLRTEDLSRQLSYYGSKIRATDELLTKRQTCIKFGGYVDKQFSYSDPFSTPEYSFISASAGYAEIHVSICIYSGGTGHIAVIPCFNNIEYERRLYKTTSVSQDLNTSVLVPVVAGVNKIKIKTIYGYITIQQNIASYDICVCGYDLFAISDCFKFAVCSNGIKFGATWITHKAINSYLSPVESFYLPAYATRLIDNVIDVVPKYFPIYDSSTDTFSTSTMFVTYITNIGFASFFSYDGTTQGSTNSAVSGAKIGAFEGTYNINRNAVIVYVSSTAEHVYYRHFSMTSFGEIQTLDIPYEDYIKVTSVREPTDKVAFIFTNSDLQNKLVISCTIPRTGYDFTIPSNYTDIGYGSRVNARFTSATNIEVIMATEDGVLQKNIDISGTSPVITSTENLGFYDAIIKCTEGNFYVINRAVTYVANT